VYVCLPETRFGGDRLVMEVYRIVLCQMKMCGGRRVFLSKTVHNFLCRIKVLSTYVAYAAYLYTEGSNLKGQMQPKCELLTSVSLSS
jgi:hypothetical protein